MEIENSSRGQGYSTLFMAIWLRLCLEANVTPGTVSINKPLLALTLMRFGFTPVIVEVATATSSRNTTTSYDKPERKRKRNSIRQLPLMVEVSRDEQGMVCLYCKGEGDFLKLKDGFTETERTSQRLVLLEEPTYPRGRMVEIRTRYVPPHVYGDNVLYGLRLDASQGECKGGGNAMTVAGQEDLLRVLTGRLRGFYD